MCGGVAAPTEEARGTEAVPWTLLAIGATASLVSGEDPAPGSGAGRAGGERGHSGAGSRQRGAAPPLHPPAPGRAGNAQTTRG